MEDSPETGNRRQGILVPPGTVRLLRLRPYSVRPARADSRALDEGNFANGLRPSTGGPLACPPVGAALTPAEARSCADSGELDACVSVQPAQTQPHGVLRRSMLSSSDSTSKLAAIAAD